MAMAGIVRTRDLAHPLFVVAAADLAFKWENEALYGISRCSDLDTGLL